MALTKDLLKVLDDDGEPLPKRLKIADNVFKTTKLPIQNKEIILFNWIGGATISQDSSVWSLLLNWLRSAQIQDLSRNDITLNDLRNLMNIVTEGVITSTQENKIIIINCATAIIENRTFQLFFKHDLCTYCVFISQIMNHIDDYDTLSKFLTNEQLYNRHLTASEDFPKYFIKNLVSLANILVKFQTHQELHRELSAVVEKCLYHRNFKIFSSYFQILYEDEKSDKITSRLPKILIKSLVDILTNSSSVATNIYSTIFHAFCASYQNNFNMIYKFFILLLETLGFDMSSYFNVPKLKKLNNSSCSVDDSIAVITALCHVLTEFNKELNSEVNGITFTEFLKNITISVISLVSEPNEIVYKFLNSVLVIDPLITEQIVNDLLVYIMLSTKTGTTKVEYENFFIRIFDVFVKLHRIPNLISKMIPTIKSALEGNFQRTSSSINYVGQKKKCVPSYNFVDLLPDKVLDYFLQCTTTFASWQVINLFKTLLFHFESAVNDLAMSCEDTTKYVYIELICSLIGQFLCSVRIAEHTITSGAVEKFVANMEELKKMLSIFGTTLVKMEHNPKLMRSYLNICHAWGELYVTLAYYSTGNGIVLPKALDTDSTASNITYLHSYLTRDQWRLISQRITNFGEKPCKQIMNKLYTQKLKAMMLFETTVSEDVLTAVKSSMLSCVDDNWRDLVNDKVVLKQIISNTNCKSIAEYLVYDITKTKNFKQLSLVDDNYSLICMTIYTCISRINKIFKKQYKKSKIDMKKSLISKICSCLTDDMFFNSGSASLIALQDVFVKEICETSTASEVSCNLNDTDLLCYMELLKHVPVIQYNNSSIQELVIIFVISVLIELRKNSMDHVQLLSQCESIIIGIAQNYSGSFKMLIEPFSTLQIILSNFEKYTDLFTHIIHNILKSEQTYTCLDDGIKCLIKNIRQEKCLHCIIIMLKYISKYKKSKVSIENKELLTEYQEMIFNVILQLIQRDKKQPDLTEAYALLVKHKLAKQADDEIAELLPFLEKYINGVCENKKNTEGSLLLFTTILRHKSKIKVSIDDISLKAWKYCQQIEDKKSEKFTELVVLIIEHVPNEQFLDILNVLFKNAVEAIKKNDHQNFMHELNMWNIILSSNLNPIKTHQWQNKVESLLLQHILPYISSVDHADNSDFNEHIVKFEINIIQRAQLPLTELLIDAIFLTVSIISNHTCQFRSTFGSSILILQTLLKFRKSQMMDYLPVYLQRYRTLLNMLCTKSNTNINYSMAGEQEVSDCAHKLEKLTNNLVSCNKHLTRIAPYLVADMLKQYEEITLLPNVKMHINNCLYSLISLCDEHAVSYLMRILSTASTEMFKVLYENYKKYYKFTGKV